MLFILKFNGINYTIRSATEKDARELSELRFGEAGMIL